MSELSVIKEEQSAKLQKAEVLESAEGDRMKNEMTLEFDAISVNEGFARVAVAAFIASLNPTLEEVSDVKTAVSEAVTNAIIHGYDNTYGYTKNSTTKPFVGKINEGRVTVRCLIEKGILHVDVEDRGKGIENIDKAMEPLYTTKADLERSGMGFAFMEAFMDDLEVESEVGKGTVVHMKKKFGIGPWIHRED